MCYYNDLDDGYTYSLRIMVQNDKNLRVFSPVLTKEVNMMKFHFSNHVMENTRGIKEISLLYPTYYGKVDDHINYAC